MYHLKFIKYIKSLFRSKIINDPVINFIEISQVKYFLMFEKSILFTNKEIDIVKSLIDKQFILVNDKCIFIQTHIHKENVLDDKQYYIYKCKDDYYIVYIEHVISNIKYNYIIEKNKNYFLLDQIDEFFNFLKSIKNDIT